MVYGGQELSIRAPDKGQKGYVLGMKKQLKKVVCICLSSLILVGTMSVSALAANEGTIQNRAKAQQLIIDSQGKDSVSTELVSEVAAGLELLEDVYMDALVDAVQLNEDGTVSYLNKAGDGAVDYISVKETAGGDIVLNIREGDLQNELVYTADGKHTVDGFEVTSAVSSKAEATPKAGAIMRAGVRSQVVAITLSANSSGTGLVMPTGFSASGTQNNYSGISAGKKLAELTRGAIIDVCKEKYAKAICEVLFGMSEVNTKAILATAFNNRKEDFDKLKENYPNSTNLSMTSIIHSKTGNDSLYSEFIYEFKVYGNSTHSGTPALAAAKKTIEAT